MADYAISNVPRRVVYANSGVGPYAFTFEILNQTDIAVYRGSTLLTLTTDYSVTINANGTGSITLVTAGTGNITIVGAKNIQRTTDFTTGGDLFANTLNDELDNQTIFIQQVAETAERGLKAPVTDPTDIAMTLPAKAGRAGKVLAFDSTTGNPVAGPALDSVATVIEQSANINTVADNIASVITDANNITNINTVAGVSGNVTTVASSISNVNTVASDLNEPVSEINTVAVNIADVNTVGTNIASVNTVAGINSAVSTVATNQSSVNTVATNIANVNATATNIANVNAVGADLLEPVSEINTVATDIANVNTVGANIANVNTVAGISANVTTVAGISANVTAVANDATDIGTVAGSIANVNTVATNISAVNTNATNITAIQNASTNATNAAASAVAAGNAQTAAEAARDATLAAYDNFDDRYLGTKSTDPTLDNDGNALAAGALYFNSVDGAMKVYTGSAWVAAYVSGSGYLASSNNLSDVSSAASARTNLGLGTAATTDATAYATAAQGAKADSALQPAAIGSTVQGYDADIPTVSASQAEMESGSEAALRSMSPLRVKQAITANAPQAFSAGTLMLFQQTSAPTGWTKQTTHDNKALRVVSGTAGSGGTTAFTSVFQNQTVTTSVSISGTTGGTTLSTSQMPSHSHSFGVGNMGYPNYGRISIEGTVDAFSTSTSSEGGNGSHSHSFSGSGSGTSSAVTLNVQYVDLIIASKN